MVGFLLYFVLVIFKQQSGAPLSVMFYYVIAKYSGIARKCSNVAEIWDLSGLNYPHRIFINKL